MSEKASFFYREINGRVNILKDEFTRVVPDTNNSPTLPKSRTNQKQSF